MSDDAGQPHAPEVAPGPRPRRPRPAGASSSRRRLEELPVPPAAGAATAGMLVGVAAVVLVILGMQACELLRDSPSCGGPGLIMLVAIVIALILLGRLLLALVQVPEATVVSLLGVTLAIVAVLAGFVEQPYSAWMWLAMPLLGAASFALCHLVLTLAAKPDADA